jgi:hypothetical protein
MTHAVLVAGGTGRQLEFLVSMQFLCNVSADHRHLRAGGELS